MVPWAQAATRDYIRADSQMISSLKMPAAGNSCVPTVYKNLNRVYRDLLGVCTTRTAQTLLN